MNKFSHRVDKVQARTSWFHLLPVTSYAVIVEATGEIVYVGKESKALLLCDHLIMAYSVGVHVGMSIKTVSEVMGMVEVPGKI